ncbi:MAG: hypothetical protein WA885_05880 [Phormidesmis sp.]
MAQDVTQWLSEIQSLQRQLGELRQERDQAYASTDNLRRLYEAEAQQRRRDIESHNRQTAQLQQSLAAFQAFASADLTSEMASVQSNYSVEQLQGQLVAAKKQCEQLKKMLIAEQTEHAQTRESLTAALGDAVDLLAKERPQAKAQQPE